jgi:hypothetical protein
MSKSDKLHRYYDNFTVVERVNLILAALERGDKFEVFALHSRCPPADDFQHDFRILGLGRTAAMFIIQLLAREVFVAIKFAQLADEPGADPATRATLRSLLEHETAIWRGFVAWCEDAGHDPHQVLRLAPIVSDDRDPAFFLVRSAVESLESCLADREDAFLDPDRVQGWRDIFADFFRWASGEKEPW